MNNNSSLKEYYVKIQQLYANAVNMLSAINQSFSSNSSEITVSFVDTDDVTQTVRIPSFLYIESKLEQLDNNLSNLVNMPKSGEAWFSKASNMYKLELVKSNTAPITPAISSSSTLHAYTKDTNILKDLVSPKVYLKIDMANIPDNVERMFMKKITIPTKALYDELSNAGLQSYEEYNAYLYNLRKGVDYDEYDSEISMPLRRDTYKSAFSISEIPEQNDEVDEVNPYVNSDGNLVWKVKLDTLVYTDPEDSSIEYMLHQGQYLTIDDGYAIYKVLSTNTYTDTDETQSHEVTLEEIVGHVSLQATDENSAMVLHIYDNSYDEWHYLELPLEEDQYIIVFLSTIWNNVRSQMSSPLLVNLGEVTMQDKDGNTLIENGKEVTYIDYYNKYCKNIGDLLVGISDVAYSQLSNYTNTELEELTDGTVVQSYVSQTISNDILKVQRINTHLIDDQYSDQLVNLHSKKNELSAQLRAVEDNIDDTYTQLVNTSSNDTNVNVQSIKSQLDSYYTERVKLQKEIISIVDNINVLKTNVYGTADAKYRIRGNASVDNLEGYFDENYVNCNVIGLQYEYKYKSITKDTTNVSNINSSIFTEWNRVTNEDKERELSFDDTTNTYNVKYSSYGSTENVVKWNQIDIPITQGEDVVIRVRFKYSIGQPFINLFTPWSDELTIEFPVEYNDTLEINSIIEQNDDDTIQASFSKTLINDGYEEHISNKIVDNSQTFYHMPENIYSGFNTTENKFISLKDKLQSMSNDIDAYKELFDTENMSSYRVFLEWDNNSIELVSNTTNNIVINDTSNIQLNNDNFIKKNMNIVIRNVGEVPLKLYSIFPGNTSTALFQTNKKYDNDLSKYQSVPLLYGNDALISNCIYVQRLGQWAYFRDDNAYTQVSSYSYNDNIIEHQDSRDTVVFDSLSDSDYDPTNNDYQFHLSGEVNIHDVMTSDNNQLRLPYRRRPTNDQLLLDLLKIVENLDSVSDVKASISEQVKERNYGKMQISDFIYTYDNTTGMSNTKYMNPFILKYENIFVYTKQDSTSSTSGSDIYSSLSSTSKDVTISNIISSGYTLINYPTATSEDSFTGGFLIPQLQADTDLLCDNDNFYKQLNTGESISIPVIFEYYLNSSCASIYKTLHLDLKTKLTSDIAHYDICMNAVYDYQSVTQNKYNVSNIDVG